MDSEASRVRSVHEIMQESYEVKQALLADTRLIQDIEMAAQTMIESYRSGGKALICGNGGSAADAQHFAAELSGRFLFDRDPLPAEALHANTSYLTAVANDYDYDATFARAVRASGAAGDVLVAISTSGRSANVVKAAEVARSLNLEIIGLTGEDGGPIAKLATLCINIPSNVTARIQESHIAVIHAISEIVEATLFPQPNESRAHADTGQ